MCCTAALGAQWIGFHVMANAHACAIARSCCCNELVTISCYICASRFPFPYAPGTCMGMGSCPDCPRVFRTKPTRSVHPSVKHDHERVIGCCLHCLMGCQAAHGTCRLSELSTVGSEGLEESVPTCHAAHFFTVSVSGNITCMNKCRHLPSTAQRAHYHPIAASCMVFSSNVT